MFRRKTRSRIARGGIAQFHRFPMGRTVSKEQEIEMFRHRAQVLRQQLEAIAGRVDTLGHTGKGKTGKKPPAIAVVNTERCTGCAICADVCPQGAIRVIDIAEINEEKCTGCGVCVQRCPNGAITLKRPG